MMNERTDTLNLSPEAEIAQLRRKVESLMAERVTPAIAAVASEAEAAAQAAGDQVRAQAHRAEQAVREQPLTALGLAALAGFVIATLIRR